MDGGGVEDIGAVFGYAGDAGEFAGAGVVFGQGQDQVHAGRVRTYGYGGDVEVAQRQGGRSGILPRHHHLNEGVVDQRSGWVEPFHQYFEGHVLVFEGF
ncbi:hypothetical protein MSIMFI_05609 [Mycobacterium simulans]|nr:hypothetical protein MSIMFI_05609 [Mycobacterium simulans]